MPYKVIIWNVTIIPVTVPRRPANGATTEIILTAPIPLSIEGLSAIIASASLSSSVSISLLKFSSPTFRTLPNGFLTSRTFDPAWDLTALPKTNRLHNFQNAMPIPIKPTVMIAYPTCLPCCALSAIEGV